MCIHHYHIIVCQYLISILHIVKDHMYLFYRLLRLRLSRRSSYPFLHTLRSLFYSNINGRVVKTINVSELMLYLDAITLAYWAIDDGARSGSSGFYLLLRLSRRAKSFSFEECYSLAGLLHYNFGLVCTIQNHEGRPVIYITAQSMPHFRALVLPHFHSSMMYKLI